VIPVQCGTDGKLGTIFEMRQRLKEELPLQEVMFHNISTISILMVTDLFFLNSGACLQQTKN
jgi:hypothetical protein